jgi:hypothetical protein
VLGGQHGPAAHVAVVGRVHVLIHQWQLVKRGKVLRGRVRAWVCGEGADAIGPA